MLARKGRASYLGERSVGHQDPGATTVALLLQAAADARRLTDRRTRKEATRMTRDRASASWSSRTAVRWPRAAVALAGRDAARPRGARSRSPPGWTRRPSAPTRSQIKEAIEQVDGPAGVVVLMDLGSAVLSAELALDLLDDPTTRDRVMLSPGADRRGADRRRGGRGRAARAAPRSRPRRAAR